MNFKQVRNVAAVLLLTTALSGCKVMGITIIGFNDKIKVNNFEDFQERVEELELTLDDEYGFGTARSFYTNLLKIGAYRGLNIDDIDVSKGLVDVNVKSVLPDDRYSQLQSSYAVISQDVLNGITVDDIQKTADVLEREAVLKYTNKVQTLEADIDNKINNIQEYIDRSKTLLGTVAISGDATIEVQEDENNLQKIATIRTEILNGSSYNIKDINVNFKVLDPRENNAVVTEVSSIVSFDRKMSGDQIRFSRETSRLDVGEKVRIQVDIVEGNVTQLQPGIYNVIGEIFRITTTNNEVIDMEGLLFALAQAERIKNNISEYKNNIQVMFSSSFDR